MFAVPGWTLATDQIKPQKEALLEKSVNQEEKIEKQNKNLKRKRGNERNGKKALKVTDENLGDLWKQHVEKVSSHKEHTNPIESVRAGEPIKKQRRKGRDGKGDDASNSAASTTTRLDEAKIETEHPEANDGVIGLPDSEESRARQNTPTKEDFVKAVSDIPTDAEDGKIKYERRKAKVERKRQQRAEKQANGALPPDRPTLGLATDTGIDPRVHKNGNARNIPQEGKSSSEQPSTMLKKNHIPQPQPDHAKRQSPPPAPPSTTKLTPLQSRMAAKLISARFRHLNETLYTTSSSDAVSLFSSSPQAYSSYHAGFRAQVAAWPSNPILGFIEDIKIRGSVRRDRGSQGKAFRQQKGKGKNKQQGTEVEAAVDVSVEPLPRSKGACAIADLGCGDAGLAGALAPLSQPGKLNLSIRSFDLAKGDGPNGDLVTVADTTDLAAVGVQDDCVDLAICCLSLMGTNWVDVVAECSRIVRAGGEVWVAEIKSRFVRKEELKHRIGREKELAENKKKGGKKKGKNDEVDDELAQTADHVIPEELEEPSKDDKDKTDVSAFVEVWRKRGFSLKGEPDMGNKMFVKMRFVKERAPKEDHAEGRGTFQGKPKFLDQSSQDGKMAFDEAKVLKPCVYKTR